MVRIFGTNEAVVADAEFGLDVAIQLRHARREGFGRETFLLSPSPAVLRVLVGAGEKKGLIAEPAVVAGERIGADQLVDEAKMRCGSRVHNGGRHVELSHL